jgi:hypothetical protein
MGLTKPFAFMGTSGPAEFDPTLGGTISPAHWYDFTDDSTMTFGGGGNIITEITSKGTITPGSIAKGTGTKYTTNYVGPEYDSTNKLTIFSGSSTTNSGLARRYGTSPGYDLGFGAGDQYTTAVFYEGNWSSVTGVNENVVSNKGQGSTGLPEEDSWARLAMVTYPGTNQYVVDSVISSAYAYTGHRLSTTNNVSYIMSYNGSSEVVNDIGPFVSLYRMNDGTDATTGFNVKLTSTNTGSATTPMNRNGNASTHENLSIGSRSRNNVYSGPTFRVRHLLSYKSILTGANIDDINASYTAAYPNDNFNPLP